MQIRSFTRPTRLTLLASLAAAPVLTGCVPQDKYDDLMTAYRSKEQQVLTLQGDLDSSRANEEALRTQLAQAAEDLRQAQLLAGANGGNIDELRKRYEDLLARIATLDKPILGEQITAALEQLAAQYPDVFEFDAKRGMLRFKSDVTFDSGKTTLSSKAQDVLRKVASILNTGDANNLEVKVVGHTDSQPIRNVAAQHPTNMFLSAHRAIAVRDQLVRDGVNSGRFQVAGYGPYRPLVSNGPNGARENRRVEIFLTPLNVDLASLPSGNELTPGGAAPAPARANVPAVSQPRATAPEEPTK
ncbi:MAG: OmpA family protein [Phycisphaerae bacterium]|nr:OmpA family protein [Phycisphaerae bacterium]